MQARQRIEVSLNEKRLLDIIELMAYIGLGEHKAIEFAKSINARRQIGGRVLYDRVKIDQHFNKLNEEN